MSTNQNELRANQQKAIEALLSGFNHKTAASAAGVTPRTLSQWKREQPFIDVLQARSRDAVKDAARRLTGTMDLAVDVLTDVMTNGETETARLRAAQTVIDAGMRLFDAVDVLERLDALEARI